VNPIVSRIPPVAAAESDRSTVHYFNRAFRAWLIYTLKAAGFFADRAAATVSETVSDGSKK